MADHFVQGAFAFTCSTSEAALIEEAWQLAAELMGDFETSSVSDEFLDVFPPSIAGKPLSGFTSIFDDANFPNFGVTIRVENSAEDTQVCTVSIFGTTDFQPWSIAGLIQRCCPASLAKTPIGFDWSYSCTKPYPDSFGGWCAVFPDRIEIETTKEAVSNARGAGITMNSCDHWADDPAHPVEDWKTEVANDDTRRGFCDWVASRVEMRSADAGRTGAAPTRRRRDAIRIRATDRLGNVAYIHREADRSIRCTLANGLSASLFYAGITADEMTCRFALDDCETADQALAIVRRYGSLDYGYCHAGPPPSFDDLGDTPTALALLVRIIGEIDRIGLSDPAMPSVFDLQLIDRASTLTAMETASLAHRG